MSQYTLALIDISEPEITLTSGLEVLFTVPFEHADAVSVTLCQTYQAMAAGPCIQLREIVRRRSTFMASKPNNVVLSRANYNQFRMHIHG
jgi:hypothetical protein